MENFEENVPVYFAFYEENRTYIIADWDIEKYVYRSFYQENNYIYEYDIV